MTGRSDSSLLVEVDKSKLVELLKIHVVVHDWKLLLFSGWPRRQKFNRWRRLSASFACLALGLEALYVLIGFRIVANGWRREYSFGLTRFPVRGRDLISFSCGITILLPFKGEIIWQDHTGTVKHRFRPTVFTAHQIIGLSGWSYLKFNWSTLAWLGALQHFVLSQCLRECRMRRKMLDCAVVFSLDLGGRLELRNPNWAACTLYRAYVRLWHAEPGQFALW